MIIRRAPVMRHHWFRVAGDVLHTPDDPCAYARCGLPQRDHVESVGEWMDPAHWFIPGAMGPVIYCLICGRHWRHSTHKWISAKWRQLHRPRTERKHRK